MAFAWPWKTEKPWQCCGPFLSLVFPLASTTLVGLFCAAKGKDLFHEFCLRILLHPSIEAFLPFLWESERPLGLLIALGAGKYISAFLLQNKPAFFFQRSHALVFEAVIDSENLGIF